MNERFFSRALLILGSIAVVLAALPYRAFDLDRFFVPKELVLHAAALSLALISLRRREELELNTVDLLLVLYLALSLASAFFAPDYWLAGRALAITFSAAALFWAARSAAAGGARRAIVAAAAGAAVLGAAASLAQAYGLKSALFSLYRIPGGTLGNRNFMAHLAVIGAPALLCTAVTARRSRGAVLGAAGLALVSAALVLSRSRAAYLGLGAGAVLTAFGLWRARGRWNDPRAALRLKAAALAAFLGLLGALALPNKLEWRSDSPYLDTVTGMVNYHKGSGHGRLVQYKRTLRIAAAHPLLGVGPGNWPEVYPRFAPHYDPSISRSSGGTMNPWPSSDWMAVLSERGFPALAAVLLALAALLAGGWRSAFQAADTDGRAEGLALAATVAVTAVVASFDAVLLLPAPAFIAWTLFGALAAFSPARRSVALTPGGRRWLMAAVLLAGTAALLRSSCQIAAMDIYSKARSLARFSEAARLDPGNARMRARLAALREAGQARPAGDGQAAAAAPEEAAGQSAPAGAAAAEGTAAPATPEEPAEQPSPINAENAD